MDNSVESAVTRSAAVGNSMHALQPSSGAHMLFGPAGPDSTAAGERSHIEEFGLRHLKTLAEIEQILHLREAIDLSVHSSTDFLALEKKETSAVSWGPSNCAG
jgi:hypothetical protein